MYRSSPATPSRFNAGSSKYGSMPTAVVGIGQVRFPGE
jgi:hypothetical protein